MPGVYCTFQYLIDSGVDIKQSPLTKNLDSFGCNSTKRSMSLKYSLI
jgi:hypothetical protein